MIGCKPSTTKSVLQVHIQTGNTEVKPPIIYKMQVLGPEVPLLLKMMVST